MKTLNKRVLKQCLRNIKRFGNVEEVSKNFRNYSKLKRFFSKNKAVPKSFLSKFFPLKLREKRRKEAYTLLRAKYDAFIKNSFAKSKMIMKNTESKETFSTLKLQSYCNHILKVAYLKFPRKEVLKVIWYYYKLVRDDEKALPSQLRLEYGKWMAANEFARKLRLKTYKFEVKREKKYVEVIPGIFDIFQLNKEDQYLMKISSAIDAFFDKKNWKRYKRNYTLPNIDIKKSSFEVKLNKKQEFHNIINETVINR